MRILLEGGPADGRETETHVHARAVNVPKRMKGGFGAIVYRRTDRRRDGAIIFSCNEPKLDTHAKS